MLLSNQSKWVRHLTLAGSNHENIIISDTSSPQISDETAFKFFNDTDTDYYSFVVTSNPRPPPGYSRQDCTTWRIGNVEPHASVEFSVDDIQNLCNNGMGYCDFDVHLSRNCTGPVVAQLSFMKLYSPFSPIDRHKDINANEYKVVARFSDELNDQRNNEIINAYRAPENQLANREVHLRKSMYYYIENKSGDHATAETSPCITADANNVLAQRVGTWTITNYLLFRGCPSGVDCVVHVYEIRNPLPNHVKYSCGPINWQGCT